MSRHEVYRAVTLIVSGGLIAALGRLALTGRSDRLDRVLLRRSQGRPNRPAAFPTASDEFNLATARAAAVARDLESWVHRYLSGPGNNAPFSQGLWKQQRYWRGPLLVSLRHLERTCGPEEHMLWREPAESWNRRLAELQRTFHSIEDWPPLIVQCEDGRLFIRDGSHRSAALEAMGLERMWIILWYAGEGAYRRHADTGFAIPPVSGSGRKRVQLEPDSSE